MSEKHHQRCCNGNPNNIRHHNIQRNAYDLYLLLFIVFNGVCVCVCVIYSLHTHVLICSFNNNNNLPTLHTHTHVETHQCNFCSNIHMTECARERVLI